MDVEGIAVLIRESALCKSNGKTSGSAYGVRARRCPFLEIFRKGCDNSLKTVPERE